MRTQKKHHPDAAELRVATKLEDARAQQPRATFLCVATVCGHGVAALKMRLAARDLPLFLVFCEM